MKNPVPYRVECRWPINSWFEVIAAFNALAVARDYAMDCQHANPGLSYQVTYRGKAMYNETFCKSEAVLRKHLGRPA